eukprot:TRINITY_DN2109_c0_g1_i1.p1 TRINITY_DN2109_c0_g1~~TRINITY_DN2109_c0_g1_i1.p1  ORF type:complete len:110 (-),score=13.23 TRINITY_DN2109_c0_g1_i1:160-489(-)
MAALVLRIKFPDTFPLIYKTLRVDANFTTKEAVKFIAETVNCSSLLVGSEGLYVPDEKRWLDDNTPLSEYDSLQDVEHIEFRDKNNTGNDNGNGGGGGNGDGGSCCTIL